MRRDQWGYQTFLLLLILFTCNITSENTDLENRYFADNVTMCRT